MTVSKKIVLCVCIILCINNHHLLAQNHGDPIEKETEVYPFHRVVTLGAIRFYQTVLGPTKGPSSTCPMYPSCSRYGYLSFTTYNPLKAFMMTADRLHRCGHDLKNYPYITDMHGISGHFDPPYPSFAEGLIREETSTFYLVGLSQTAITDNHREEDERLFHYAEILRSEHEYNRAITEYRRLLSYFQESSYRSGSLKGVFYCYDGLKEYLTAIHWGQELLDKKLLEQEDDLAELRFGIAASYLKLGNVRMSREYLAQVSQTFPEGQYQEKSLLLQGFSYAKESNWKQAEHVFASVQPPSQFAEHAQHCVELSQQGQNLHLKNPAVAGMLAVVPGLGYLYDGYKQSALASFIVNGLFIWGTVEAFRQDNNGLGVVLGLFSAGWYAGNIYGSITTAQRRNIKMKEDLLLQFNLGFSF